MLRPWIFSALVMAGLAQALVPASPAWAHSEKQSTQPADGTVLQSAPEVIMMTFDSPMRLTMVRLVDANGTEVALQRSDGMAPVTAFKATPEPMPPGDYTVEWRGLSADGHAMQGDFSFRIED